ncbi:amidase family protein [Streptomyces nodosus]|uniref:amidase family protein n=1 Tax=Streptomyces nodosus TaxID=40318 RepID=UPI0034533501
MAGERPVVVGGLVVHGTPQMRHREPINAIVTLDPEGATAASAEADRRLARGRAVGPLHGLPIAFKDTHLTRGMRTTHGSPLFADHVPDTDELLVERIQNAGAIRVGNTNVPEVAAGSHTSTRYSAPPATPTTSPARRAASSPGTRAWSPWRPTCWSRPSRSPVAQARHAAGRPRAG